MRLHGQETMVTGGSVTASAVVGGPGVVAEELEQFLQESKSHCSHLQQKREG